MKLIRNFSNAVTVAESTNKYVTLRDGTRMPMVGLGTFEISEPYHVQTAITCGYRMLDTAVSFGNEDLIGEALKQVFSMTRCPVRRKDLFIISKLPSIGHRNVDYLIKSSLNTLHLDYFDLYLIHNPFALKAKPPEHMFKVEEGELSIDEEANILETWRNMEKAVDAGLVRNIGLSNFNKRQIENIYNNSKIKPANLQVECHPFLPQQTLHKFCQEKGITVTAFSPLGASYYLNSGTDPDFPVLLDYPIFHDIGKHYKKSPAQIILRWLIQRGITVIPKSSSLNHQLENINIFDFSLSQDDLSVINNIGKRYRYVTLDSLPELLNHPEYPFEKEPLD